MGDFDAFDDLIVLVTLDTFDDSADSDDLDDWDAFDDFAEFDPLTTIMIMITNATLTLFDPGGGGRCAPTPRKGAYP